MRVSETAQQYFHIYTQWVLYLNTSNSIRPHKSAAYTLTTGRRQCLVMYPVTNLIEWVEIDNK